MRQAMRQLVLVTRQEKRTKMDSTLFYMHKQWSKINI